MKKMAVPLEKEFFELSLPFQKKETCVVRGLIRPDTTDYSVPTRSLVMYCQTARLIRICMYHTIVRCGMSHTVC